MEQVLVRKLEAGVKRRLRVRAKSNGRSLEEEVRVILREAAKETLPVEEDGLGTRLARIFAGKVPKGFKIKELRGKPQIPDFSE